MLTYTRGLVPSSPSKKTPKMKHYLTLSVSEKLLLLQNAVQRYFYKRNMLLLEDTIKVWLKKLKLDYHYTLDSVSFTNSIQASIYLRRNTMNEHHYLTIPFRYSN